MLVNDENKELKKKKANKNNYFDIREEEAVINYINSEDYREKKNLQQPMTMIAPMTNEIDTNGQHYHVNHVKSRPKKNIIFGQDKVFLIS